MLDRILEVHPTDTFIIVDGFDEAIIGLDESTMCLIYSVEKCIEIIISDNEMLLEQAIEHFNFNISDKYMGEGTPIFCEDTF